VKPLSSSWLLFHAALLAAIASAASGQVSIRPISDFISTQGTFCVPDGNGGCQLFVPPVANFIGWTNAGCEAGGSGAQRGAAVDYAGLANTYVKQASGGSISLGTGFSGRVIERALPDGRAQVTVLLFTKNALAWVADGCDFLGTLLFGNRAPDVVSGATPALADSFLQFVFTNTAPGAPLPDLIRFTSGFTLPGQALISAHFEATATGELHAAFGVAEDTPGLMKVSETGTLFRTHFKGATADGFPAEFISLHVIGK
jgi:hypothetical protein